MNQENQGKSSAVPVSILPAKRRRGRPRKDENPLYMWKATVSPVPDLVKRNQHQSAESTAQTDNGLVGQIVSGVLDGSFDAGYLLTVKVGNTNTVLRGVVFEPGLSVPISAANDVAPHVKMFKRSEIPLPVISPLNQVPVSTPHSEVKIEQPTNPVPKTATAIPVVGSLSDNNCLPKELSKDANHVAQAAPQVSQCSVKPESSSIHAKGQPDLVHQMLPIASQASPSTIEKGKSIDILPNKSNQSPSSAAQTGMLDMTSITNKSSDDSWAFPVAACSLPSEPKNERPVVVLQESETPFQPTLSNGSTATSDLELVPKTEQLVKISLGDGNGKEGCVAINQASQVQINTLESPMNLDSSVDAPKDVPAETNHPPLATRLGFSQENSAALFDGSTNAEIQADLILSGETTSNVSNEILKRDEATHLIEGSIADATDATKDDLLTRPAMNALCDIQSGYAGNQLTPTQHAMEPQSCDRITSTQEEPLISNDAVSMQSPIESMELVTATGFMQPNEAADNVQVNEVKAVPESPSGF